MNEFNNPFLRSIHFQITPTTTGESSTGKKNTERKKLLPIIFLFKISAVINEKMIINPTWKKTNVIVL